MTAVDDERLDMSQTLVSRLPLNIGKPVGDSIKKMWKKLTYNELSNGQKLTVEFFSATAKVVYPTRARIIYQFSTFIWFIVF